MQKIHIIWRVSLVCIYLSVTIANAQQTMDKPPHILIDFTGTGEGADMTSRRVQDGGTVLAEASVQTDAIVDHLYGNSHDHRNNNAGQDNEEEEDQSALKCRCASYCNQDEYFAATCSDWIRNRYCCQYRTCGKCHCARYCQPEDVIKGACNMFYLRCCSRCSKDVLIDQTES